MRTYTLDGKKLPLKGDAKPACETCRFWRYTDDGSGDCLRLPPQVMRITDDGIACAWWPETSHDDWCGEYEEAAQAVK